jgi:hypothetical protein
MGPGGQSLFGIEVQNKRKPPAPCGKINAMRLLAWGLIPGLVIGVIVTWWPPSWQYAPGIIFGIALAIYFSLGKFDHFPLKKVDLLSALAFVGVSYIAYSASLMEAEWILGTNGFATFESYANSSAMPALFVACFVGGCIGAFLLAIGIRVFFLKFDIVRGLFLFSMFSGAIGSLVIAGFETFGFIPQFIFPIWDSGLMVVVWYIGYIGRNKEDEH